MSSSKALAVLVRSYDLNNRRRTRRLPLPCLQLFETVSVTRFDFRDYQTGFGVQAQYLLSAPKK